MPVAAGSRLYQDYIPSFMSVYDVDTTTARNSAVAAKQAGKVESTATEHAVEAQQAIDSTNRHHHSHIHHHKHANSTSTQASESTDSSPTTTISTADSSALTDPSPSSSPESPVTIIPLSSFAATNFGALPIRELKMSDAQQDDLKPLGYDRPLTSPSMKKPRNAKGLALRLPGGDAAPLQCSEPCSPSIASPSFIRPTVPKPKKKPSILSLQTTANAGLPFRQQNFEAPPTPSLRLGSNYGDEIRPTTLRHHHSSPHMTFSPDPRGLSGPAGGMQLPEFQRSRITGLSTAFRKPVIQKTLSSLSTEATIAEEESPIVSQMATRTTADIGGDKFDADPSQEDAKSPGYPNGPVAIYEPNVYLYLEPTADEARKFDVIINVADDVRNPFVIESEKRLEEAAAAAQRAQCPNLVSIEQSRTPEPESAVSISSFQTAFEFFPGDSQSTPTEISPTTPRPSSSARADPEYIHVPWQHGTDISKELLDLCEIIEKRTKEDKKVLVHCLLGQSRSASLIIAYGMYQNPDLTVNESYYAAQAKSRWISPNMKLMYALNDFRKLLHLKLQATGGYKNRLGRSPTKHRATVSADAAEMSPNQPHTAPLPADREPSVGSDSPNGNSPRPRGNSTPALTGVNPGPSSAPSSFSWPPQMQQTQVEEDGSYGLWTLQRNYISESQPTTSFMPAPSHPPPPPPLAKHSENLPPLAQSSPQGFGAHRRTLRLGDTPPLASKSFTDLPAPPLHNSTSSATLRPTDNQTPSQPSCKPRRILKAPLSLGNIHQQFTNRQGAAPSPPSPSLWSPRIQEMNGVSMHQSFLFHEPTRDETPPTPSIMSPRGPTFGGLGDGGVGIGATATAVANPFATATYSTANDAVAGMGFGFLASAAVRAQPRKENDPRSPPTQGEAPIIRSIDDMM